MKLSQRAHEIEPFYAMAFGDRAAVLESRGEHVVKLCLGEPDFGAPPAVRAAMAEVMDGRPLAYTSALGQRDLREAIAGFYLDRHGVVVEPSRIVVTSGASAALVLTVAATIDPGSKVIMADPSYPCNRQIVESFGGVVTSVATSASTRFQLTGSLVENAWASDTRAVMMASPSNPTGTSIPRDALAEICALARERGAWRIVDEIYLNLADHDDHGGSPRSSLSIDPDVIVINSFSKYFGMTGWRLGWCVFPASLGPAIERLAMNYFLCASTPAQHAALACFTAETLAWCEDRRLELLVRRAFVLEKLVHMGFSIPAIPNGAFYVYFDVSVTGLDSWVFCERALQEAHVALTPGKDFGAQTGHRYVRLSYTASFDELREGLTSLRAFVKGLR
jgi:aspartate/methionine/tyrosine aminotransferase